MPPSLDATPDTSAPMCDRKRPHPASSHEESQKKAFKCSSVEAQQVEAWKCSSPVLNHCRLLAPELQGRTAKVLLPCGGIDAPGWAARALGLTFEVVGYFDTDPHYGAYMANMGVEPSRLHVGAEHGDFNRLALSHVPACNMLVAGPPCPPFSKIGNRNMFADDRTHVLWHTIAVICHCAATQAGFGCFVLENVTGMLDVPGGLRQNPMGKGPGSRD